MLLRCTAQFSFVAFVSGLKTLVFCFVVSGLVVVGFQLDNCVVGVGVVLLNYWVVVGVNWPRRL